MKKTNKKLIRFLALALVFASLLCTRVFTYAASDNIPVVMEEDAHELVPMMASGCGHTHIKLLQSNPLLLAS